MTRAEQVTFLRKTSDSYVKNRGRWCVDSLLATEARRAATEDYTEASCRPERFGPHPVAKPFETEESVYSPLVSYASLFLIGDSKHCLRDAPEAQVPRHASAFFLVDLKTVQEHFCRSNSSVVISAGIAPVSKGRKPFAPSREITCFLVERARGTGLIDSCVDDAALHEAASEQVKEAVIGLLDSMASTMRQRGELEFVLGGAGKFEESVVKALLYRVSVGFYEAVGFAGELFREVELAAVSGSIAGSFWALKRKEDGTVVLEITDPLPEPKKLGTQRHRARVVTYGVETA